MSPATALALGSACLCFAVVFRNPWTRTLYVLAAIAWFANAWAAR